MSLRIDGPPAALGFGAPPATFVGQAVGGIGAFSEAAYRHADEIRRSIALPPAAPAGTQATGSLAGALAGYVASPAGHAALDRLASAAGSWLERALGAAGAAEQLALPLA